MATSGTTSFNLPIADVVVEAYSRIQVRGPELTTEHIIEARRSANLILQDWSGNRDVNLWAVDLLQIPLVAGVATYTLPPDTIQVLDVYQRQFTQSTAGFTTLGNALTPILVGGVPLITLTGDVIVVAPGSGTLSTAAGSQTITMNWPLHGLLPGAPIFFNMPVSVGGMTLPSYVVVDSVVDINTLTFIAPQAASGTLASMGAPPLLGTTSSSNVITVYLPRHGYTVGSTFTIQNATTVGGVTIPAGSYTVASVPNYYSFTFALTGLFASSTTAAFENGGRIQVTSQQANTDPIDIVMYGLSRSEYAAIPDKNIQGFPTSFWFDRQVNPNITVWEVPPTNTGTGTSQPMGLAIYRMRQIQDANPVGGQTLDMPGRFQPAFCAELTAAVAEKFAPALFEEKAKLAVMAWERAANSDSENVPWYITPGLTGYYS